MSTELVDPLFKGSTRPAMWQGIPLEVLYGIVATGLIIGTLTTLFVVPLIIPFLWMASMITRTNDHAFRLWSLWFKMRVANFNWNALFWKASSYSPLVRK